jgi:hypothetical protein
MILVVFCSCHKQMESPAINKKLNLSEFSSMLSKERTFIITEYYKNDQQLSIPDVNSEDTYAFDGILNDGWVLSKEPCIEYHYNFRTFTSNNGILFEWVDFNISPETFIVSDYRMNEWFVLKHGDTFTKYQVKNKND